MTKLLQLLADTGREVAVAQIDARLHKLARRRMRRDRIVAIATLQSLRKALTGKCLRIHGASREIGSGVYGGEKNSSAQK